MMDRAAVFPIIILVFVNCLEAKSFTTSRMLLNNITDSLTYDRGYPAEYDELSPSNVIDQLKICDITAMNEQRLEYSMRMLLRTQWKDTRLASNDSANFTRIDSTGDMVDLIRTPDVYISNERQVDAHYVVKHEELAYFDPYETVSSSIRVSTTLYCLMDLHYHPFDDDQICNIMLQRYSFTSDKLLLQWSRNGVRNSDISLANNDTKVGNQEVVFEQSEDESIRDGKLSSLKLILEAKRKNSAYGYVYFTLLPLFFVLALCLFGLRDHFAPRNTLCTTLLSTSGLQGIAIYSRLPTVWYLTCLDGWTITYVSIICLMFVWNNVKYFLNCQGIEMENEKENEKGSEKEQEPADRVSGTPTSDSNKTGSWPVSFYLILLSLQACGTFALPISSRTELLKNLTNPTIYDRNYPAVYDEFIPCEVLVQLNILDVTSIMEQNMQYSMMSILRLQWNDKRLAFNNIANLSGIDLIGDMVDLIWKPDVYITNEIKADAHSFLKVEELAYIDPNGTVTFSIRNSMTSHCHMDLKSYPFDIQTCGLRLQSYTLSSDKLLLSWAEEAVIMEHIDLTNYKVELGNHMGGIDKNKRNSLLGGDYSYLYAGIKITRRSQAYGSMYFAPFPIFFVIAMCSFWFGNEMKVKVNLCTAGLTTTVLQWIAIYSRLPPVWYFTFLDGWIIFHICMIGAILIFHVGWFLRKNQCDKMPQREELVEKKDDKKLQRGDNEEAQVGSKTGACINFTKKNVLEICGFACFLLVYAIVCIIMLVFWSGIGDGYVFLIMLPILISIIFFIIIRLVKTNRCTKCCCNKDDDRSKSGYERI